MKTMYALLFGAALIVAAPSAFAASDAGNPKLQPVHREIVSRKIERFKDIREVAYENNTQGYAELDSVQESSPYGDQVNVIPAKERVYEYKYDRNGMQVPTGRYNYETR